MSKGSILEFSFHLEGLHWGNWLGNQRCGHVAGRCHFCVHQIIIHLEKFRIPCSGVCWRPMLHNQLLVASILNLHIAASYLPDEAYCHVPIVQRFLCCAQQYHFGALHPHRWRSISSGDDLSGLWIQLQQNPVVGVVTINLKLFFLCHFFQSGSTLYGLVCIVWVLWKVENFPTSMLIK